MGSFKDKIIFYSNLIRPKDTMIGLHNHSCYEIVYYLHANGTIAINENPYPFENHCWSFSKPHSWQREEHKEDGELLFIGFDTEKNIGLAEGIYPDDANFSMLKLLREILYECTNQKAAFETMLHLKLQELLILLQRVENKNPHELYNFEYTVNFIREHYQTKIDFQSLAASCGYSYDYFRHQFQKKTGVSPQQYLIFTRLEAAKTLLREGSLNCTEITYLCGFSSCAQFSSMFKARYGVPPSQFSTKKIG